MELQLQHQSFHEYAGLISFRIDLFDLLAVQGSLKSLHMIYLFLAALGLHCCRFFLVATSGSYSLLQRTGFSSWWLLFLQSSGFGCLGSVVVAHRLVIGFFCLARNQAAP